MITGTKAETKAIERQPFDHDRAIEFCGSKKLAKRLLVNLGEALLEADKAIVRGESEDTEFDLMFWDGTLVLDTDQMFDLGIHDADDIEFLSEHVRHDANTDATFALGRIGGRKFVAVRWEWKESEYALSMWWLERKKRR